MRCGLSAALLTALSMAFPAAPATADETCPGKAQRFQRLKSAEAEIAYRWEPAELKVSQFFAAEVVACRVPGPKPVQAIAIDATMPAHGHGMNYRPKAERLAAGHHRFSGLMLHMPGTWHVTFDLIHGETRTRLTHEIDLKR